MTKHHTLGGSDSRNLGSHSPGGWKSETEVSQGWFLLNIVRENLFCPLSQLLGVCWQSLAVLGALKHHTNLCLRFLRHSPCVCLLVCVQIPLSYKDTSHFELGPILMALSELDYHCKDPASR